MIPFTDLDTWLANLAALDGVSSAVLDPAQLETPGVWVRIPSFALDTLQDEQYRVDLEVHLVVGDAEWSVARQQLGSLFDTVSAHLGRPRVTATFETLALPDSSAVPALRFPFTLRLVPDPAP